MKKYYRISELSDKVNEKYEKGVNKGADIGFKCLEDLYSVKLGCTTYIYGSPASGKTEFWFEILINLSQKYGWKHAIYSPETGSPSDIAIELMHKWAGKPFFDNLDRDSKANRLTKEEVYRLTAELDQYFYIIDAGSYDFTIAEFYDLIDTIEDENDIKIQTTLADPINEYRHDLQGAPRDMYLESILGRVRRNARDKNRHNCLITHVTSQQLQQTTDIDARVINYYPLPTYRQIAGGESWSRKGDAMIAVWRPVKGMLDERNNRFYDGNEVIIAIQKAKPKGIGNIGITHMWFDVQKSRYYELDGVFNHAAKAYAFELEDRYKKKELLNSNITVSRIAESALRPSTQFEINIEEEIEPPF